MTSRTGSRTLRASSASRAASISMDPLRSAKRTVTCLRSPSSADLESRIRSARYFGVYVSGDVERGRGTVTGSPHEGQKLAPVGTSRRHRVHAPTRSSPHSRQNLAPGGFSRLHDAHLIDRSSSARIVGAGTGYRYGWT